MDRTFLIKNEAVSVFSSAQILSSICRLVEAAPTKQLSAPQFREAHIQEKGQTQLTAITCCVGEQKVQFTMLQAEEGNV